MVKYMFSLLKKPFEFVLENEVWRRFNDIFR